MFNNSITLGLVKPLSGGGNQDLESVLGFGDRPVKRIDDESELIYDGNFVDFQTSDAQHYLLMQLNSFILLLKQGIFEDNAEVEIFTQVDFAGSIQVGDRVEVLYNGKTLQTDDLIEIEIGSKATLKKIYSYLQRQPTTPPVDIPIDVFALTLENVQPPPVYIHNLAQVIEYGDRDAYAGFPLAPGTLDLTPTQRYQTIALTNETITESKIIWIDQTCAIPQAEYKISNTSDWQVQLRPKDGITFFGDNFFVPKNSVAIIKCIQQFVNGQIVNFRSFLITFQGQEKKEFLAKVLGQNNAGLNLQTSKNTTTTKFIFNRIDVGRFSISNFDKDKHILTAIAYNSHAKVGYTAEEDLLYTYYAKDLSDSLFEFGGWIKIEEIR